MMGEKSERQWEKYKIWVMAVLLAGVCLSLYYFHTVLRTGTVVTHFFYVPIVLAATWWKRKGLVVALFLSGFLIFSHVFLRTDVATYNDYFRALMFMAIAFVVAELSRRITKEEEKALRAANQQLQANEQQFRAANQQLRASEQQLRAANQQLQASEQQLRAANQQLRAGNQQLRANEKQLVSEINERKKVEKALRESEGRFRQVVENAEEWVWDVDVNGLYTYASPIVKRILGYKPEEIVGKKHFYDLFHPEDREEWKKRAFEVFAEKQSFREFINRNVHENGETVWLSTSGVPILDEEGNLLGYRGADADITERKQAEEALRKEKDKAQKYLDVAGVILMVIGEDRKVRLINQKGYQILGYNEEDIVGKDWFDNFLPKRLRKEVKAVFKKLVAGKIEPVECFENPILTKDGDERLIAWHNTVLRDKQGQITDVLSSGEDITERRRFEEKLKQYQLMVESAYDAIFFKDLESRYIIANNKTLEAFGLSREQVIGKSDYEIMPDREEARRNIEDDNLVFKTGKLTEITKRMTGADGKERWFQAIKAPQFDDEGKIIGLIGIARDITERKQAEEALWESEERFRGIFENSLVGLYRTTPDGRILVANPALVRMLGYSSFEELAQRNLEVDGYLPEYPRLVFKQRIEAEGQVIGLESAWMRHDGSTLFVRESARAIRDKLGNTLYYEGTVEDITERRRAEEKLLDYQAKLKSLASELSLAEERERRRIATELHDQISQSLVISKTKLESLRESVSVGELTEALEEVCNYLGQVIQDTRTLTFDLSFPILYELGFEAAVAEWLNGQIREKHGIETDFEDDRHPKPLEDDIRVLLFRNVRELLINVVKHANAQNVKVSIHRVGERVCVRVEDDGVGFDLAEVASKAAFGLFSIRERLEQLGGHFEIESEPGRGSKITMTAPLKYEEITDGAQV